MRRSRSDKPKENYMYTLQVFNTLNIVDLLLIVAKSILNQGKKKINIDQWTMRKWGQCQMNHARETCTGYNNICI